MAFKRKVPTNAKKTNEKKSAVDDIVKAAEDGVHEADRPVDYSRMLSTGSTLLDLAICGGRTRYGGIPGGIIVEIYGVSGGGKTAVMSEIMGSALSSGGKIKVSDPEGRLDAEYSKVYGVHYNEKDYDRPDTVVQAFVIGREFMTANERENITDPINVVGTDSIAALSTELEMTKGDKMGQRRAKDFSQEMRLTTRVVANSGNLLICTNQVRQGEYGLVTPGGMAPEFYASLRLQITKVPTKNVVRTIDLKKGKDDENTEGKIKKPKKKGDGEKTKIERTVGVCSNVWIQKSTVDAPYRTAPIYIMFGYGIDDIRANLQWLKEMAVDSMYECPDGYRSNGIEKAIEHIEQEGLEKDLKEKVVNLWHALEAQFSRKRKPKVR